MALRPPSLAIVLPLILIALWGCYVPPPLPPAGPMPEGAAWTGVWDTTFERLEMVQEGGKVTGSYAYGDGHSGIVVGQVHGNTLRFRWTEEAGGHGGGRGVFVMVDGGRFEGVWGDGYSDNGGGSWSGTRSGESAHVAAVQQANAKTRAVSDVQEFAIVGMMKESGVPTPMIVFYKGTPAMRFDIEGGGGLHQMTCGITGEWVHLRTVDGAEEARAIARASDRAKVGAHYEVSAWLKGRTVHCGRAEVVR